MGIVYILGKSRIPPYGKKDIRQFTKNIRRFTKIMERFTNIVKSSFIKVVVYLKSYREPTDSKKQRRDCLTDAHNVQRQCHLSLGSSASVVVPLVGSSPSAAIVAGDLSSGSSSKRKQFDTDPTDSKRQKRDYLIDACHNVQRQCHLSPDNSASAVVVVVGNSDSAAIVALDLSSGSSSKRKQTDTDPTDSKKTETRLSDGCLSQEVMR